MHDLPSFRPLRVAIITRDLMTGGAQRHIVKLCQTVPRSEAHISLFLLIRDAPQDLLTDLPDDVPVFISPFCRHHPLVIPWLAYNLANQGIQIAHSFLWIPDAFAALTHLLTHSCPLICSERGDRGGDFYSRNRNLFDRLVTFPVAHKFCANSSYGSALLQRLGCPPAKLRVIYNGIDIARIDSSLPLDLRYRLGWPQTSLVIGMVSRLVRHKGIDSFIRALSILSPDFPVYGVIVGDGPMRAELTALARELGIIQRIIFLGQRTDVERLVKGFDIAVSTTRIGTEHCSNSILEYMACERPVVATYVGGNPELVRDADNGVLVPADDPLAVVQALQRLGTDAGLRQQMGRNGRLRIERDFDQKMVATQFLELWRTVAA